jgi:hypothetical protein
VAEIHREQMENTRTQIEQMKMGDGADSEQIAQAEHHLAVQVRLSTVPSTLMVNLLPTLATPLPCPLACPAHPLPCPCSPPPPAIIIALHFPPCSFTRSTSRRR